MGEEESNVQDSTDFLDDALADVRMWQQQLVRGVLRTLVSVGAVAILAAVYFAYVSQDFWLIPFYLGAYVVLVLLSSWRQVPYVLQAGILLALCYGMGVLVLIGRGLGTTGQIYLSVVPIFSILWFGRREGIWVLILTIVTLVIFAWVFITGRIVITREQVNYANSGIWASSIITFVLLGSMLLASGNYMVTRLADALAQSRKSAKEQEVAQNKLVESIAEREGLQQEVIDAQKQVIQELTTPIIPLLNVPGVGAIIVLPLVGNLDSMRAKEMTRSLLAGIREHSAKVVILDITGVPVVDSNVVGHLTRTIQAARLKGADTIVTGISEIVAETIVDLGIDWTGVRTLSDLQMGLIAALNSLGVKLTRVDIS
ncbi:MAG: STAS domain-containing protein [Chloroflexi bacterium]|nr:STAS domain-containing protein [Chloroflexota bacterium]